MPKTDQHYMSLAVQAAQNGQGHVEPNPMVGCVIVADDQVIGIGWHENYGGPHAELNAMTSVKAELKDKIAGATAYVSLEPCSHQGKTGPCCDALIAAKIARVVIAVVDPNPKVSGQGIAKMQVAGIEVVTDVLTDKAEQVLAPYLKRTRTGVPWVIAKWAMTIDGSIASATGDSQWISNEKSRKRVHDLRRRVDAVMVGIGTALADDPMLNPRPAGKRIVTRVVVDSAVRLPLDSKLVKTSNEFPTLIAVDGDQAKTQADKIAAFEASGCQVWQSAPGQDPNQRLLGLLKHLASNGVTNLMVEGGGQILGALNDLSLIDEVHLFTGAKLLGGKNTRTPVAGTGPSLMNAATEMQLQQVERIDNDVYSVYRRVNEA